MDGHKAPFIKTAWTLIVVLVLGIGFLQTGLMDDEQDQQIDEVGLIMLQIQGECLLGIATMVEQDEVIVRSAYSLDVGTVDQRQRYMALMIAFGELDAARQSALKMDADAVRVDHQMTDEQQQTQDLLDVLIEGEVLQAEHTPLADTLGWFGTLLDADQSQRKQLEEAAVVKVVLGGIVLFGVLIAGLCGFVALVFFVIRSFGGSMSSGLPPKAPRHGVYAEVFALWLVLFVGLTTCAALTSNLLAKDNVFIGMVFTLVAFFNSLLALCWALIRGITWKELREDIGWHRGKGFIREVACGFASYAMTIPILGIGLLATFFLMAVQLLLTGGAESNPFAGTGGGAHPIIVEIAQGSVPLRILLVVLAVVAAPIVEETMFRGVLYRHLRSSSQVLNNVVSIFLSVLLVSFIFAAIHPQGWVAIPTLMSLAIGMNVAREWRGSLIPSMVVHGTSNGIVTGMMLFFLS